MKKFIFIFKNYVSIKIFLLFILITFTSKVSSQPREVVIQTGVCGKDAEIGNCIPCGYSTTNYGNTPEFNAAAWTNSGSISNLRSLLQFELLNIPPGSLVYSAHLSLFFDPSSSNGQHSSLTGPNEAILMKITAPWSESTVTWNNQPTTTSTNQVNIPASTTPTQDYTNIDITAMVQDFINNPAQNYGLMLMMADEQPYRRLIFASSDHPDALLHPRLVISYSPSNSAVITITPAGSTTICTGGNVTLNATVIDEVSYQWYYNGTLINGATTSSYIANLQGNYTVTATSTCGIVVASLPVTVSVNSIPPLPGAIAATGGNTKVCPGDTKIYTIPAVTGAASYTWTSPAGSNIISGQGTTSVTVEFLPAFPVSDTLRVVANNPCGSSAERKLKITRNDPFKPGAITTSGGVAKVCPGEVKTYSILPVTNATSYFWTAPDGAIITSGQGTTTVTVSYTSAFSASDTIKVYSINTCGSSVERILKINRNNPATPGVVSGQNYNLCNSTGMTYSVANIAGMTYNWAFGVTTAVITSGQGTNNIIADYLTGFIYTVLSVTATNACGTSAPRNFNVYSKPPTPASVTGSLSVCANQQDVPYSISPIANITNYTWIGPAGSHISDGINTSVTNTLVTSSPSVTVDFSTSGGSLKVRANNSCASGSYKSVTVSIVCREGLVSIEEDFAVSISPNPNNGEFSIQLNNLSDSKPQVSVIDVLGHEITKLELQQLHQDIKLNLIPGIYYLIIRSEGQYMTKKIIVQH